MLLAEAQHRSIHGHQPRHYMENIGKILCRQEDAEPTGEGAAAAGEDGCHLNAYNRRSLLISYQDYAIKFQFDGATWVTVSPSHTM